MSIFRTLELHKQLSEINTRRAKALAVSINSNGNINLLQNNVFDRRISSPM